MTTHVTETTKALPPRRAAFVREYLVDLNASRAARDVGYAAKSASVEGWRLLANSDVQAEIARQRAILAEQSNVTPEKIVAELAVIAFSDLGDYIRIHPDGTASIELGNMPPGATRAIASLNTDTSRTAADKQVTKLRFKLHDKHAALVSLAKILGMFQESSVNLTIESHDSTKLAVLSTEDLRRVLDSGVFDNQADTDAEDAERPCLREVSTPSESDE
jgi:phage terminase small subunit